ncbi:MAG: 4Fe-4S dicluster domain-containing protein [Acidobacteria bacterium]|nr:4Fe-4S dicluster domain-containing protein [Acidobacteriota bacterium]
MQEHNEHAAQPESRKYRWGMVIDLDRCTGCQACVVACHAENNIPIAGEVETYRGHATNWIHVERYFEGEYPHIKTRFIPVLCQQCDSAPCEPVCPVYATYKNPEGINAMIYNRCVGTRYCANNCPYTVRYFNWWDPVWPEPLPQQLNPDSPVRMKGVMEKCNFCSQRITRARDHAEDENRDIRDGEIKPACVQSCPTNAMYFGDLADPETEVSRRAHGGRGYKLLEELGTQPRVIYLKEEDWSGKAG